MYREDKSEEWLVLAENARGTFQHGSIPVPKNFLKKQHLEKRDMIHLVVLLYRLCMKEWIHLHYLMCQSYMSWENKLVRQDGLKGQKQYGEMAASMYQMER